MENLRHPSSAPHAAESSMSSREGSHKVGAVFTNTVAVSVALLKLEEEVGPNVPTRPEPSFDWSQPLKIIVAEPRKPGSGLKRMRSLHRNSKALVAVVEGRTA